MLFFGLHIRTIPLALGIMADEVAAMMCTNRTYLSRMFNEELTCTFSDYINRK